MSSRQNVVIVGGGFGGIHTLLGLQKPARQGKIEITLISNVGFHAYLPMMHEVATAGVDPYHVIKPIELFKKQVPFRFVQGHVSSVDLMKKTLSMCYNCECAPHGPLCNIKATGKSLNLDIDLERQRLLGYDYLVLAPGSQPNTFGIEGVKENAFMFSSLDEVIALRDHIFGLFDIVPFVTDPEYRKRLLTFVIVGAGPTGVETATELHDLVFHSFLNESLLEGYADEVSIYLVNADSRPLSGSAEEMQSFAEAKLGDKKIHLINGVPATKVERGRVHLKDHSPVDTETVIWAAGVKASSLMDSLPGAKDHWGRVMVERDLSIPDYPKVFVIGDSCHIIEKGESQSLPPTAQVALQEARVVADNICRDLEGTARKEFRFHFLGQMISLGKYYAGANLFGAVQFRGRLAWLMWKVVYLRHLLKIQPFWRTLLDWINDLTEDREAERMKMARVRKLR